MLRLVCFELLKKFVIVYYVVKFKVFWEVFVYFLIYSLRRYDRNGFQFVIVCSFFVVRGDFDGFFVEVSIKIEEKLRLLLGCMEWNLFLIDFWISE